MRIIRGEDIASKTFSYTCRACGKVQLLTDINRNAANGRMIRTKNWSKSHSKKWLCPIHKTGFGKIAKYSRKPGS